MKPACQEPYIMFKLSSLTLAAALLSSLALPAMAQNTVPARPVVRHAPKHAVHKAASTPGSTVAGPGTAGTATPGAEANRPATAAPGQTMAAPANPTPAAKPAAKVN